MLNLKAIAASGVLLAAAVAAPICQAQTTTIKVVTAGSSAQWGVFAEAARALAGTFAGASGTVHNWTIKGGTNAVLHDNRSATAGIPDEAGNLWVVWSVDASGNKNVWAYLSVDSVVGVRAYEAAPRDTLVLSAAALAAAGQNLLSTPNGGLLPLDDTTLDMAVGSALTGHVLTAANTDIRPEDALFATTRALTATGSGGLGYLPNSAITDSTGGVAHVEKFAISGTDPVSGDPVASFTTLPIGASPIVFFANTSNTGAGHLGQSGITLNIDNGLGGTTTNTASELFSGASCKGNLVGGSSSTQTINAVLREPTSGTMNTAEFTDFTLSGGGASQETGVNPAMQPFSATCTGGGTRIRAIGTGDETKLVLANADTVGYAFFSYEALPFGTASSPSTALSYKYLKLDNVDPLLPASAGTGVFPSCGSPTTYLCEAANSSIGGFTAFNSFEHLRDGTYDSWSVYRALVAPGTTDATNMQQLIDVTEPVVDEALPDFVPLTPKCAGTTLKPASVSGTITLNGRTTYHFDEPGLEVFRSHYDQSGVTAANGAIFASDASCTTPTSHTWHSAFVGGTTEAGGDVGGLIIVVGNAVPSGSDISDTGHRQ